MLSGRASTKWRNQPMELGSCRSIRQYGRRFGAMTFHGPLSASPTARDKREYHTLDAMRGVAAVIVVIGHCGVLWGGWQPASAYLAVDLFFLLSGFVLEHAYG